MPCIGGWLLSPASGRFHRSLIEIATPNFQLFSQRSSQPDPSWPFPRRCCSTQPHVWNPATGQYIAGYVRTPWPCASNLALGHSARRITLDLALGASHMPPTVTTSLKKLVTNCTSSTAAVLLFFCLVVLQDSSEYAHH